MNHSPADIIRYLLIDKGCGTLPTLRQAWPIYVSAEPDSPDNVITIYDTTGLLDGRLQKTGETVKHHGVQIRVRAKDGPTGTVKIRSIESVLNEVVYRDSVTIDGSTYLVHAASQKSSVITLGKDPENSNRYLYTINYTVDVVPQ